jgi:hypothetical protein
MRHTIKLPNYIVYGLPRGILHENEFQNPQIFQKTMSLFPEHSTLVRTSIIGVSKN